MASADSGARAAERASRGDLGRSSGRVEHVDYLRGLLMLFILCDTRGLKRLLIGAFGDAAWASQLYHAEWLGFTPLDVIFPGFLFTVGVSSSIVARRVLLKGVDFGSMTRNVADRFFGLFLIGLLYESLYSLSHGVGLRLTGVLQRIAICYAVTVLAITSGGRRRVARLAAGMLALYAAILLWVPAPGFEPRDFSIAGSIVNHVDLLLLPGRLYRPGEFDPEGILSTLGAVATSLIGALFLTTSAGAAAGRRWLVGGALLGGGLAFSQLIPFSKMLYTPSFALLVSGMFWWLLLFLESVPRLPFKHVVNAIGKNSLLVFLIRRVWRFCWDVLERHLDVDLMRTDRGWMLAFGLGFTIAVTFLLVYLDRIGWYFSPRLGRWLPPRAAPLQG